ncbi:Uncharacterised protein [Mycobacterium tuberculosis]|nr:Uncharacterised protein [Mycobacterium tuberculosis]
MRVAAFLEPVCSEAVIGHRVERVPASPMLRRGDTIRWAASRPAAVPWPRDFDGGARCRRGGDRRGRRAARAASASAHLSGPHLRLSDERPRLRAAGGSAGSGRLPEGDRRFRGRRRGVQHLRRPRERRQQAVRQPQPSGPAQARQSRHANRGRWLPGAKRPRRRAAQGAVGRRCLRHPQHRVFAHAAGARPAQQGRPGRNRRGAATVPVVAAQLPRICLCRVGFHLGGLQQQLHVLHRPVAAG